MKDVHLSVDVVWQEGVREDYIDAAEATLRTAVHHLGLSEMLPVERIGAWRSEEGCGINDLVVAAKADAIEAGLQPGQLLASSVSPRLRDAPWRPQDWRGFSLLIVGDDYACKGEEYVFGFANAGLCATLSTYRYERDTRISDPIAAFVAGVFHEFGHVVGAPNGDRTEAIQDWLGAHCTNACVMRQRDDLPEWETDIVKDLFGGKLYCDLCLRDIQIFLRERLAPPRQWTGRLAKKV